jgi:hypothetical protein
MVKVMGIPLPFIFGDKLILNDTWKMEYNHHDITTNLPGPDAHA